jgi:hypothetical protein
MLFDSNYDLPAPNSNQVNMKMPAVIDELMERLEATYEDRIYQINELNDQVMEMMEKTKQLLDQLQDPVAD